MNKKRVRQAKHGDTVQIHYTGGAANGAPFGSSTPHNPLQFIIGEGQVLAGLEQAVIGMRPGEVKTTRIPMTQAYGMRRKNLIVTVDRHQLPAKLVPKTGQRLRLHGKDGREVIVTVTSVSPSKVTLDANPPLAGQTLVFDIQLLAIREPIHRSAKAGDQTNMIHRSHAS